MEKYVPEYNAFIRCLYKRIGMEGINALGIELEWAPFGKCILNVERHGTNQRLRTVVVRNNKGGSDYEWAPRIGVASRAIDLSSLRLTFRGLQGHVLIGHLIRPPMGVPLHPEIR